MSNRALMEKSSTLLQLALLGLVAASIWQAFEAKRCANCATGPAPAAPASDGPLG
jgi:hypothetical protein